MKNTDIQKIRQLLDRAIVRLSITDTESECIVRQALALLPCETDNEIENIEVPEGYLLIKADSFLAKLNKIILDTSS